MFSMTGYSSRTFQYNNQEWTLQVRGVNNRFLDLAIKVPSSAEQLEEIITKRIKSTVNRGRVEVSLRAGKLAEQKGATLNHAKATALVAELKQFAESADINANITLGDLVQVASLFETDTSLDMQEFAKVLMPELNQALEEFLKARAQEGTALAKDLDNQIARIEGVLQWIEEHQQSMEERFRTQIMERYAELLQGQLNSQPGGGGGGGQLEHDRLSSEVALLLMRYGINEEVVRLAAHCKSFRATLFKEGSVGKELEFFVQEMHREVNTIGSKSTQVELSNRVITMKGAIEDMREQLRNVE